MKNLVNLHGYQPNCLAKIIPISIPGFSTSFEIIESARTDGERADISHFICMI